jgi:GxxExxY protein
MPRRDPNSITEQIIGAAIDVHPALGPGLLESAYEACLEYGLTEVGLAVQRQRALPLTYRALRLECAYRLDLTIEESVVVEVKAVDHLLPVHHAQVISYLKLSGSSVGLLINFHAATLKEGIRRFVNGLRPSAASSPSTSAPLR